MKQGIAAVFMAAVLAAPSLGGAAPRPAEREAREARLPGKPTGPIAVEHRLAAQPSVGVPLELTITARVEAEVTGVTIEANASAPSAVLVTVPELVAAGDNVYAWRITVVPLAAEAGYLTVIVAGDVDGLAQAHSVTVSLRSSAPPSAAPAPTGGDELLIALPVQEGP